MAEQNTLREAANNVVIEGTLLEVRHNEWKSKEGINIELDIEVRENEVHTLKGMTRYKKKDGSDNGIAKGYQTIIDEYLSVAKHGRDQADKVRVTQGKIGVNEYYGQQDGLLKSFPELSTNFVNRIGAGDEFNPRAEFEVEIFVKSVVPEIKNDDETGRVKVNAIIPVFGGKVIPFEFMVSQEGAEFVADNYEVGCTTKVYGDIVNFKEVKETEVPVAFGKPQKKISTKTIREYLITGGTDSYEEDSVKAYTIESIQKAMVERETYLMELKNKPSNNNKQQEEKKGGFGTKPKTEEKAKFDKVKLPF
jgi:hypothetical protein